METSFDKIGDVLKVTVKGRMVAAFIDGFKAELFRRINENRYILFDLSQMSYIDSSGLGVLVSALDKALTNGCTIKLAALQPSPRIVFDITKVYRIFDIYDTCGHAIASFYKSGAPQPPKSPNETAASVSGL